MPPLRSCCAFCLLVTAAVAEPGLLQNGSFESGDTGWTADQALAANGHFAVIDEARRGQVGELENTGQQTVGVYQNLPVQAGKVYELSGWWKSTTLEEGAGAAIHALDADGKVLERHWLHHIPSWGFSGWRQLKGRYRPPAKAITLQFRITIYRRGKVWVDDLVLTAAEPPKKLPVWGDKVTDVGFGIEAVPMARPTLRLTVCDLDGDGVEELISGDVDSNLVCCDRDGEQRWRVPLGGLALDLATGDLTGDGRPEIAVCTADQQGALKVFDASGKLLWQHVEPGVVFRHVTVGDLDGDAKAEVACTHGNEVVVLSPTHEVLWRRNYGGPRQRSVRIGDVDGDRQPDVVTSVQAQSLFGAAWSARGEPLWRFEPIEPKGLSSEDLVLADVDGDGTEDAVIGSGAGQVFCVKDGELSWLASRERNQLWPQHRDATANLSSAEAQLAVGDYLPELPGQETLVALVDSLWLLNAQGQFVWDCRSGVLLGDLVPWGTETIYVPSSSYRDPAVYRLTLRRGTNNPLADYELDNPTWRNLEQIRAQVDALPQAPPRAGPDDQVHVIYANVGWPIGGWSSFERLEQTAAELRKLSSERLEFVMMLWPKDLPVELHRGRMMEPDEILKVAKWFETKRIPFLFFIDHGCAPNLSVKLVEQTLDVAPTACRGFYVAENMAHYPNAKWWSFVKYCRQVMDLCLSHGKKLFIMKEMYDTFALLPSDPRIQAELLQPKYRDILVFIYATNNPYAPTLQIGGMAGLKQAGLIKDWGMSTQYWNWSWSAHGLSVEAPNLCPADVILRMELTGCLLGGRWCHIEGGQDYLSREGAELLPVAKLHRDLVYRLVSHGLLNAPSDDTNLSFSPVVIERSANEAQASADQQLGSPLNRRGTPLGGGLLGVREAVQSVLPDYLPGYAYDLSRYATTMFPATPYGWLRIVPDDPRVQPWLENQQVLRTDGVSDLTAAGPVDAMEAKSGILKRLAAAAEQLPFEAQGAGVYSWREGDGYRVYLVDPGYLAPLGVKTTLRYRPRATALQVTDLLSGDQQTVDGRSLPIEIAAGAFRGFDVVPR